MVGVAQSTPHHLGGYAGLRAAVGQSLGASEWMRVDQRRIDMFASVTGDTAWIHTDPVRAAAGPHGGTIAHGLLALSLVTQLAGHVFRVDGVRHALHYGYDRVRFIRPIAVDTQLRVRVAVARIDGSATRARARFLITVETDDNSEPALVAEMIYYYEFDASHDAAPD